MRDARLIRRRGLRPLALLGAFLIALVPMQAQEPHAGSPLDVPAVSVGIEAGESSAWLRESRASSGRLVPRKRTAAKPR